MIQKVVFTLILMFPYFVAAQRVIKGKLKNNIILNEITQDWLYKKIYLLAVNTEGVEPIWVPLDSSNIDSNGNFLLKNPNRFDKELCLLAFNNEGISYGIFRRIVLLKKYIQDTLYWETTAEQVRKEYNFDHNLENAVLGQAFQLIEKYEEIDELYRRKLLPDVLNRLDKQYIQKYQQIEVQTALSYDSLQTAIDKFRTQYKDTYAADILLMVYQEPFIKNRIPQEYNTRASFLKDYFFDKWEFNNEFLVTNPYLYKRLLQYLSNYTDIYTFEGIQYSVDKLLKSSKKNEKLFQYIVSFLIKIYLQNGFEKMAMYIYENYLGGCTQITSAYEELKKLEKIKQLKAGNLAPNIPLEKQGMKPFAETLKNYEQTIVYFWASSCPHCQSATPTFVNLLKKYPQIGVITVSLDSDQKSWQDYLKKNMPTHWLHYCDLKGWKSEVIKEYAIMRIPTCYVIDKNGKIIEREVYPTQVLRYLLNEPKNK